jgi:hypothetical protein
MVPFEKMKAGDIGVTDQGYPDGLRRFFRRVVMSKISPLIHLSDVKTLVKQKNICIGTQDATKRLIISDQSRHAGPGPSQKNLNRGNGDNKGQNDLNDFFHDSP